MVLESLFQNYLKVLRRIANMKNNFRTYHRRSVTRTSGYHVCDDTTGGECIIKKSTKLILAFDNINLIFKPKNLKLVELFENRTSIFGFGGYIKFCFYRVRDGAE